ncbi:MAG: hypothetical protein IAF58_22615 [Leptolyngbya sp.]|nr:hypothetical protein [Candidatus Melainabacteria bacterium]
MKLDWISALNEQTSWTSNNEVLDWLESICGKRLSVDDLSLRTFLSSLDFMREQATCLHFGHALKIEQLNARTEKLALIFRLSEKPSKLPPLMANLSGNSDPKILKSISDTLFLGFIVFLSNAAQEASGNSIARCEGLFREPPKERKRLGAAKIEDETAWRREIPLLQEAQSEDVNEIQRCEDLFIFSPKAKFCSDACRFSTFQITKQLKEPGYIAEKQRRYRSRKEKT